MTKLLGLYIKRIGRGLWSDASFEEATVRMQLIATVARNT